MLGINDNEARLKFAKAANRLQRKGWSWPEIAERLLGHRRYARGAKRLAGAGYTARLLIASC